MTTLLMTLRRQRLTSMLALLLSVFALFLPSCQVKAVEPTVEDMIKGHEEWARALIVLRLGRMHPSGN